MATLRALVFAAVLLVLSFLLAILACTAVAPRNALPLLPLFISILSPIPFVLCGRPHGSFTEEHLLDGIGLFLGGALTIAGPALTCVLYHTGGIGGPAFFLSIGSESLLAGTVFMLTSSNSEEGGDGEYDF